MYKRQVGSTRSCPTSTISPHLAIASLYSGGLYIRDKEKWLRNVANPLHFITVLYIYDNKVKDVYKRQIIYYLKRRVNLNLSEYLLLFQILGVYPSRMEPPGCAMYLTPEALARLMLSGKGKKASEPRETPSNLDRNSRLSSSVNRSGWRVK